MNRVHQYVYLRWLTTLVIWAQIIAHVESNLWVFTGVVVTNFVLMFVFAFVASCDEAVRESLEQE